MSPPDYDARRHILARSLIMGKELDPDSCVAPDRVEAAGGSFTDAVQRMFDSLAPRYDTFNRWASLGLDTAWRCAAIRQLGVPAGGAVLDIATGTGDLALASASAGQPARIRIAAARFSFSGAAPCCKR